MESASVPVPMPLRRRAKSAALLAWAMASSYEIRPSRNSPVRDWSKVCIPYCACPFAMVFGISSGPSWVFNRSLIRGVASISSMAGIRPEPSLRDRSRWLTTARSTDASISRTCWCSCFSNTDRMRFTVSRASTVCIVDSTRCPVSAACSAVSIVSRSRISPSRTTSGSWRSADRRPAANVGTSVRTSRCVTTARRSSITNSIGSSIETMWQARTRLI